MERLTSYENECNREMICRHEDCCIDEEYCPHQNEDNCLCLQEVIKKLADYEDLEEQGFLLKLPCKVGDIVYFISERTEKQGRRKSVTEFVDRGEVDNIALGSAMIPQITVCDSNYAWITFDSIEDFGKTVFLTQTEAEEALERMEREE